jgi:D-cysteine desulfhydrase
MPLREPDRLPLALLPTPLVRAPRLAAELGGADVWIKRDDLTGVELSGNKVRKLEYILADARARGCTAIVTEGTPQSNHCRATAAACARLGLHCTLLLRPLPPAEPQGNHLLDLLFGAETRAWSREEFAARHDELVAEAIADLERAGHRPHFTPMGASEPRGCWGYIHAAAELGHQLREHKLTGADVVVAISSGATYAGLVLGRELHGLSDVDIWAVPVSDDVDYHQRGVLALCDAAARQFDLPVEIDAGQLRFIDGYVGPGYAVPYAEAIRAIKMLAHSEAVVLDPVYTGKAFAAFVDAVRDGRFGQRRPVIFWHTGGVFSDFAWPRLLLDGMAP